MSSATSSTDTHLRDPVPDEEFPFDRKRSSTIMTTILYEECPDLFGRLWNQFESIPLINWWLATQESNTNVEERDFKAVEKAWVTDTIKRRSIHAGTPPI